MQKFHLTSAKLTGKPGDAGWAQVHDFKPEEEKKLEKRGHLFAVISTGKEEEGLESVATGRELLSRLHEEYFGELEMTPFNSLKKAVEKVINEFLSKWGGVEIAAISVVDDTIYSAAGGGAQVSIFRDGMLASILESKQGEVVAASGHPSAGDVLILSTSGLIEDIGQGVLKGSLQSGGLDDVVETIAPSVHSKEAMGRVGFAAISFEEESEVPLISKEKPEVNEPKIKGGGVEEKGQEKETKKPQTVKMPQKGFLTGALSFIKSKLPGKKLYVRSSEVDVEEVQKKKTAITIGVILLVLLVVSIVFGVRQARVREERERYQERLTQARHELEEAKSLYTLNPDRARELFANSERIVRELEEEGVEDKELASLKSEIESGRKSVLGEHDASHELFLDLSLMEGMDAQNIVSSQGEIFVLDTGRKRVVKVAINTKRTQVLAGPSQIEDPQALAGYSGQAFILEADGVYEVGNERNQVLEETWQGPALIYAYTSNLYILDKGGSSILRSQGTTSGFSTPSEWLSDGVSPDFSNVISWAIDGSIWVLTSTKNIEKYTLGNPQVLDEMVVAPPLDSPISLFTSEDQEFVYILDPGTERIVVFDKEGAYKAQYKSSILSEAIDVVVSEEEGKMIVLTKDKLYSLPINHL